MKPFLKSFLKTPAFLSSKETLILMRVISIGIIAALPLRLQAQSNCVAVPSGLVSWWPAEGDARDAADGNSGVLINGVGFIPGKVGQAFRFNGTNSYIEVPDAPTLQFTNVLTIECWVKRNRLEGGDYLIEKGGNWNSGSQNFALALHTPQFNYAPHFLWNGGWRAAGSIADTNWHHCAVVATNGQVDPAIYVDGVLQPIFYREGSATIDLHPSSRPLHIGAQVDPSSGWFFYSQADIDEMTLYDRGLSASEIQAIYNAGSSGKCVAPTGPSIFTQPANQTVTVGSDATFSVVANGSSQLSYQWRFNGTNIAGATGTSFTVVNAQFTSAGAYSVQVTNAVDSVLSSNAVLTVNPGPSLLQVENTSVASAGTVTVPVLLRANGTENALSFSLSFSTSKLAYAGTILPKNSRATLFVNESQTTNGRVGLALALPAGSTFPQGLAELADLTFRAAVVTNATSTPISFTDQPVVRQVVDVIGNVLPANYTSGNVSIAGVAYEADVSPRSTGDSTVTVADWVLIGRFAARFASPTNASEFQRADCAPRSTLGNGHISIADWVQAGRYAAGLDPLTTAGGPTAPPSVSASNTKLNSPKSRNPRQMKASDTSFSRGHTGAVSISLQAQGDENAVGFTLVFDSANLNYVGANLGNAAGGAVLNVNTDQTGVGRVGFALALSSGKNLPAGLNELIKVAFRASDTANSNGLVAFCDDVIEREISDAAANTLTADYLNGTITVYPLPSLRISQLGQNITLSWPSWATNFVLQQAEVPSNWTTLSVTPAIVNSENSVTVPISSGTKFYRLYQAH